MSVKLIGVAITFFSEPPASRFSGIVSSEFEIIRKLLAETFKKSDPYFWYYRAMLCRIEKNFQDALVYLEQFQEYYTTKFGHVSQTPLINCYIQKTGLLYCSWK